MISSFWSLSKIEKEKKIFHVSLAEFVVCNLDFAFAKLRKLTQSFCNYFIKFVFKKQTNIK